MTPPQTNSLGYIIPCHKPIELGDNVVTYCVLDGGHAGHCEPVKPSQVFNDRLEKWWREHNVNRP